MNRTGARGRRGARFALLAAGFLAAAAGSCPAADPVLRETVGGRLEAPGYSWRRGFDLEARDGVVTIRVGIHLVPAGVTPAELARVKGRWEEGVEAAWSDRFDVVGPDGRRLRIRLDADLRGPRFHHEVVVRPGAGRSDELNWNLLDAPALAAHEVGHMLGLPDEYPGGALGPDRRVDQTSIMARDPTGGVVYPRHFRWLARWFEERTGTRGWRIRPSRGAFEEPVAPAAAAPGRDEEAG